MIETDFDRPNPDLIAMRSGLGTGLSERLRDQAEIPEVGPGFKQLIERGLFRRGVHDDKTVAAKGPLGDEVELRVTPFVMKEGTIFVPDSGQDELLKVIYPRTGGWNI